MKNAYGSARPIFAAGRRAVAVLALATAQTAWCGANTPIIADSGSAPARTIESGAVGELVTDRPDFTESSEVLKKGWLQVESGFAAERFQSAGATALTLGAPLLRFGLGRNLELRLASEGAVAERPAAGEIMRVGRADSELGFKYKIASQGRFWPAFGVIGAVSTPTGNGGFSSQAWEPGIKFTWAKDVPLGFSLSGNLNWNALATNAARYHHKGITLSVGRELVYGFSGYWEVYGLSGPEPGAGRQTMFATGLTRSVGPNAQWDASISQRLTRVGPDRIYSFGFSFRQPLGVF